MEPRADWPTLAREWLCVGHVAMVAKSGDYFTVDVAGELVVIVRGNDRIRILSRVCLHRWAAVVEGAGNARRFSCPFHMWSYGLDGQLLAAPFMDQAAEFRRRDCRLPEFRSHIVGGLIFVSLTGRDDAPALTAEMPEPDTLMLVSVTDNADVPLGEVLAPRVSEGGALGRNARLLRSNDNYVVDIAVPTGGALSTVRTITLRSRSGRP